MRPPHRERGGMGAREERLARNEMLFRDINEQVEFVEKPVPPLTAPSVYEFFCECSNVDCTLRIRLALTTYEQVRSDSSQFVVAPGHELPEIEEVVARTGEYQVVRKRGKAAAMAAERDRRA
jgi:hypothetical protein